MRLSYAFSRGRGNTDSGQGDTIASQLLDDMRLDSEIGPTSIDRAAARVPQVSPAAACGAWLHVKC